MLANRIIPGQQQAAYISIVGLTTIVVIGVAACVGLVLFLMWGMCQILLLIMQSSIEALTAIRYLYTTSDPFIKLLILVAIGYVLYRVYLAITRKVK